MKKKSYIYNMAHLVLDITTIPPESEIGNARKMRDVIRRVADECGAHVLEECFHQFQPTGATAVLLLSESHISIHTYPEFATAHIDFYHCGRDVRTRLEKAIELFRQYIGGVQHYVIFER